MLAPIWKWNTWALWANFRDAFPPAAARVRCMFALCQWGWSVSNSCLPSSNQISRANYQSWWARAAHYPVMSHTAIIMALQLIFILPLGSHTGWNLCDRFITSESIAFEPRVRENRRGNRLCYNIHKPSAESIKRVHCTAPRACFNWMHIVSAVQIG